MNWDDTMKLLEVTEDITGSIRFVDSDPGDKLQAAKEKSLLSLSVDCKNVKRNFRSLEPLRNFLSFLGDPQDRLSFVHVAGSNGKGSASAMLSSVLTAAGYRTGRYISPHLIRMNERWTIDGEKISDKDLRELCLEIRDKLIKYQSQSGIIATSATLGAFDLLTVIAFVYFIRKHCDIVVLETGLGGRLDASNVIRAPECALIMPISMEHTDILGDSLEKIAYEKAGIIKRGGSVVVSIQKEEALNVIRRVSSERDAKMICVDMSSLYYSKDDSGNLSVKLSTSYFFSYRKRKGLRLSLLGSYQLENAMAVLDVLDVLIEKGWAIPEEAIREGLGEVSWPGRFELLSSDPLVILDGAHNPAGVKACISSLAEAFGAKESSGIGTGNLIILMSVMKDKDYTGMIRLLSPLAACFIALTPPGSLGRGLAAEDLKEAISLQFEGPVYAASSVKEGISLSLSLAKSLKGACVLCLGSLYQVGEIRSCFKLQ